MSAVVRLKRRRDETPAHNLLFSSKKRKITEEDQGVAASSAAVETVFKYAGTVDQIGDDVEAVVKRAIKKDKLEKNYKQARLQYGQASDDPQFKRRQKKKANTADARLKVISERRAKDWQSLGGDTDEVAKGASDGDSSQRLRLYDVEADGSREALPSSSKDEVVTCNGVPMKKTHLKEDYVYDLYYINQTNFDFRMLEEILSIEAYGNEALLHDDDNDNSDFYEDEDDENAESNWRNDYPDEDPHFYGYEAEDDELASAMSHGLHFGDDKSDEDETDIWTPSDAYNHYRHSLKEYLKDPF